MFPYRAKYTESEYDIQNNDLLYKIHQQHQNNLYLPKSESTVYPQKQTRTDVSGHANRTVNRCASFSSNILILVFFIIYMFIYYYIYICYYISRSCPCLASTLLVFDMLLIFFCANIQNILFCSIILLAEAGAVHMPQ